MTIGPVEQFESESELKAHYAAVRARIWAKPVLPLQLPPPVAAKLKKPKPDSRKSRYSSVRHSKPVFKKIEFTGNVTTFRIGDIILLRHPLTQERRIRLVIASAALKWGVSAAEIISPRRETDIVRARQEAMARIASKFPLSLPAIGRIFKRDHTTVLHSIRVYKRYPERFSAAQANRPSWSVGFEAVE